MAAFCYLRWRKISTKSVLIIAIIRATEYRDASVIHCGQWSKRDCLFVVQQVEAARQPDWSVQFWEVGGSTTSTRRDPADRAVRKFLWADGNYLSA